MKIPVEEFGWELNPDTCPPDLHFIEYLEQDIPCNLPKKTTVFHMGCGMHHSVGLWASTQKDVFVRSVSITPPEIAEYISIATDNPRLNTRYLVDFADIHLLHASLLPRFDYISLFHLGEISDQAEQYEYPGNTIDNTIMLFVNALHEGGKILFFERSAAWKKIESLVYDIFIRRLRFHQDHYKSLRIYHQPE